MKLKVAHAWKPFIGPRLHAMFSSVMSITVLGQVVIAHQASLHDRRHGANLLRAFRQKPHFSLHCFTREWLGLSAITIADLLPHLESRPDILSVISHAVRTEIQDPSLGGNSPLKILPCVLTLRSSPTSLPRQASQRRQ